MFSNQYFRRSVQYVKGVGESRAKTFLRLGLKTVGDLVQYYPRDYEDRTITKRIAEIQEGDACSVVASLAADITESRPRRNLKITKALVTDGSGFMNITWFNQDYIKKNIQPGQEYVFFGPAKRNGARVEMQNPVFEPASGIQKQTGQIMPIYPLTHGITQNILRSAIKYTLSGMEHHIVDILPASLRAQHKLAEAAFSYEQIHFPKSFSDMEAARKRLVFQELLLMQLGLLAVKGNINDQKGIAFPTVDMAPILEAIPFKLTDAQEKVFAEIEKDMESERRMNRLIQGDVGSGKTIVAVLAIYKAAKSGYQSAFMVPTEILAEQHFQSTASLFEKLGVKAGLLTGGMKKKEKEAVKAALEQGSLDLVIGTHAILEDNTAFSKLGLVVTDEQHRFGVRQRARLSIKGTNPDLLVMTATPIPRTLSLVLYGDLDVSIIDSLPPGRKPIETYAVDEGKRDRVYQFIRKLVAEGRQAYIVCPLVEDSEAIEAESAEGLAERIRDDILKDLRVGLIHGKMKSAQKDETMRLFSGGGLDVLVSTTVIEVGVNVPNASVMVIENAERFGLAQLHQLRGRVGRGEHQSYCILFNQSKSQISRQRMEIMSKSNDGFVIAEKDLELRGPGDVFGVRQHGLPEFKIANFYRDMEILKEVHETVKEMTEKAYLHQDPSYKLLKDQVDRIMQEKLDELSMN